MQRIAIIIQNAYHKMFSATIAKQFAHYYSYCQTRQCFTMFLKITAEQVIGDNALRMLEYAYDIHAI